MKGECRTFRLGARSLPSAVCLLSLLASSSRAADEFSGADKLRLLYSAEFRFTEDGLPVVPVALAQGVTEARIEGEGGVRLLPEGDGGPEVQADPVWRVRAERTTAARLRFWTVVWRGRPQQGAEAAAQARQWRAQGLQAQSFEQGALFAVAGEVLDRREVVVGVDPAPTFEAAEKSLERLRASGKLDGRPTGIYTELVDRPHGQLEAVGQPSQVRVRNEGVLWFAATADKPLRVEWRGPTPKESGRGIYHGRIYVTIDRRGGLAIVNAVPENRLLHGLVPAEIYPSSPDEALKAQAVAARGELLAKIGTRHSGEPFRLCSQTHCQVYSGAGRETPRTTAAVEATRGEILFSDGGKDLVDTVYSASCGGHTEHNENAWPDMPSLPALRGHRDVAPRPARIPSPQGVTDDLVERFVSQPSSRSLRERRAGRGPGPLSVDGPPVGPRSRQAPFGVPPGTLQKMEVLPTGYLGAGPLDPPGGANPLRGRAGRAPHPADLGGLRSSLFVVEVKDGGRHVPGGPVSGTVLECARPGAIGMAEAGKTYREILGHYYLGGAIRKLW